MLAGRGDIEIIQIGASKRYRRRLLRGSGNRPFNLTVWIITNHAASVPLRRPQESLGVHRESVRDALIQRYSYQGGAVFRLSGVDVVVVPINHAGGGIREIELCAVGRETDSVGQLKAIVKNCGLPIMVNPK